MSHSWRKRFLSRPNTEDIDPRFSFTAVQILDITRGECGVTGTKRVQVEEVLSLQSQLPELSEGTAVRWIHIGTPDMDYDLLMNFALTHQEFSKEERVSVYKLLKQFRGDQQRSSTHGKYFEPGCLRQTQLFDGAESKHQPQFISLPYITLGKASSLVNTLLPLRRSIHPIMSLLQYHYRRECAASTAMRDSEQTCSKLLGADSNPIVLVNNLWILVLNKSTIITVAPTDGERLWSDLKLINHRKVLPPESDDTNLWETLDTYASQLQQKLQSAIDELEVMLRYQRRIKSSLPSFFINIVKHHVSKSEDPPDGFLGFLFHVTNTEWTTKLQYRFSTLDSFLSGNRARFEGRKNAERSEISEEVELQSESLCLFFYENVDTYLKTFTKLRGRATISLLFPSSKATLDTLWMDVKHQSQMFLWKLSAMDLNTEVMAATGLSDIIQMREIPTEVEKLVALVIESLVPQDSTGTRSATISDIYSQYIARLQLEAQRFSSKMLVRNIYQVTEELEIISGIVKSQYRVVEQIVNAFRACTQNTDIERDSYLEVLDATLRKLQFFRADLGEYQDSCSRLAALATQRLTDSRMEHLGKAVLVLTTVTMVFLPLLFISNLLGTNFIDKREIEAGQWIFWVSALCVTFVVGSLALIMAFFGERLTKRLRRSSGGDESYGRKSSIAKKD